MWSHAITYKSTSAGYWGSQSVYSDTVLTDAGAASIGASILTMSWSRSVPTGLREDLCTCTCAFGGQFGGNLWGPLVDSDKATLEGLLDTWWTSQKALVHSTYTLVEYRWHDWHAGDALLGPADRVTSRSVAGTVVSSTRLPDQDSSTLTFTTASRRHWGRIYLPGVVQGQLDGGFGRWSTTAVDNMATYWHTLLGSVASHSWDQLVVSRQHEAVLLLSTLQVDDVVDIQRRRRAKQPNHKKIFTS